jgi:hypothetical protein
MLLITFLVEFEFRPAYFCMSVDYGLHVYGQDFFGTRDLL